MSRLFALVPAKGFELAKSRLADALAPEARAELAARLLGHVLAELEATSRLDAVAVITGSDDVAAFASARGALVLRDPPGARRLGPVIDHGLDALHARGATRALVVMADLPHLTAAAITRAIDAAHHDELLLVPDHEGSGTNVLHVPLPRRFPMRFAEARSGDLHRAAAAALGLALRIHHDGALALDLDSPADLRDAPLGSRLASRARG